MKALLKILQLAAYGIGTAFLVLAFVVAAPFALLGVLFLKSADDLEAGWRRGRQQNWLWRFARRHQ